MVVRLGIDEHGARRVDESVGVHENDIIETELIFERRGRELRLAGWMPPHPQRYERVGIDVHRVLADSRTRPVLT